jgi:hypothetical protein
MREKFLIIFLILETFPGQTWAIRPAKDPKGGQYFGKNIVKGCGQNIMPQKKITMNNRSGKKYDLCIIPPKCGDRMVFVTCPTSKNEPCESAQKCTSIPLSVSEGDSETIQISQDTDVYINLFYNATVPIPNSNSNSKALPLGKPLILVYKDGKLITPPSFYLEGHKYYVSFFDIKGNLTPGIHKFEFHLYETTFNSLWWCSEIFISFNTIPQKNVVWFKGCLSPGEAPPLFPQLQGIIKKNLILKVLPPGKSPSE